MRTSFFLFLFCTLYSNANIVLPSVLSNGMVIQRNSSFTIWGWATPKEEISVTVSWSTETYKITTGPRAIWQLSIPTPSEAVNQSITIKGYNTITLGKVSIGDVWFCSGQSNMEMNASWGIKDGEKETTFANHPMIHFFNVPKATAAYPQDNLTSQWEVCTPETMKYNSAVAYFFARRIREINPEVPIGLIISAWGGTAAEEWMPKEVFDQDPIVAQAAQRLEPSEYCPHIPSLIYNAMIHPLLHFDVKGFLWYQGESNMGSSVYDKTLSALINAWRKGWNKTLPFYLVQLAPYYNGVGNDAGVVIRNAQRIVAASLPKTYLTVISDVSETNDIHPKDKKSVGIRLANTALVNTYQQLPSNWQTPEPIITLWSDKKIIITFKNATQLKATGPLVIEVGKGGNNFTSAMATIEKNSLIISAKGSFDCLRFAWQNDAVATLSNELGQPVSSFLLFKP